MKNASITLLRFIIFVFIFIFPNQKIHAQACSFPTGHGVLSGNNITATIPINGSLFWNLDGGSGFNVNYNPTQPNPSIFHATGLWIGDWSNGALKLAASTYSYSSSFDYFAGPIINNNGELSFQCDDFNRTWEVFGFEILQHIQDFADNGIIDNPLPNIYAYPAHQNPFFEEIHGFSLPDTPQGLAPFFDQNNDGIYNPYDGDYPLPESVSSSRIPSHIVWGVFNDVGAGGPHTYSGGSPLHVEIQLTTWAFFCEGDELLNNSIFASYKIINRRNESLDSLVISKWVDMEIGCPNDNYNGCIPELNTFYTYSTLDGDSLGIINCPVAGGMFPAYDNHATQAITFLNQNMTSFVNPIRASLAPNPGMSDPTQPAEYYNYMTGNWRDGSPLTYGGNGYGGSQPTSFIYPDNPNNPNGWSAYTANIIPEDIRAIANFALDHPLAPQESTTIDMAFTFYQDENTSNLEVINLIYDQTPLLQEMYDNGFETTCAADFCLDDCVWTGDANRDSIVNNLDILQIGLGQGASGTERNKPLIWQPFDSPDWNQSADNVNLKHTDCDGNGLINHSDFAWVDWFYNKSYQTVTTPDTYHYGNEISIISDPDYPTDPFTYGTTGKAIVQLNQVEDLYGLAFTVEWNAPWTAFGIEWYDTWVDLNFSIPSSPWNPANGDFRLLNKHDNEKGEAEFAFVKTDGNNSLTENSDILSLIFSTKYNDYALVQVPLRIKNIKAILNDGTILDYGSKDFIINIVNPNGGGEILATEDLEASNILVFPNPTSNFLNVKFEESTAARFTIFDIYGKKVFEKAMSIQQNLQLPIEHFTSGIYFLKIEMDGEKWVQKFVKI